MSIIKNTPNFLKHTGFSFTTIINQMMDLIPDAGALGIYCYLSSKPENWEICQVELQRRFGVGRDYIQNKIAILKEVGAIKIQSIRDEKGKITHWETQLVNCLDVENINKKLSTDQITENPYSGCEKSRILKNQILDNPEAGKTDTSNKRDFKNKREYKNKGESKFAKSTLTALPDDFMPNKKNVELAEYRKLDADIVIGKFIHDARARGTKKANWQEALTKWILDEKFPKNNTYMNKTPEKQEKLEKCPIKFWEPGNPDYDRVNGINH